MRKDLRIQRDAVMANLKAFQRATVERITRIFYNKKHPQNRALVADEVGLGKTWIAKGVIANLAVAHEKEGHDLFKVIYICSNQAIARQNIGKLSISKENCIDNNVAETRLSMQHLRVLEQKKKYKQNHFPIQITPLTPGTSFQIISTTGRNKKGISSERALIYCILKRYIKNPALSGFLQCNVGKQQWQTLCKDFQKRIDNIHKSFPRYPDCLFKKMDKSLLSELKKIPSRRKNQSPELIAKLRKKFAEISAEELQPDLIIMDEFQRFHSLLDPQDDDLRMLTENFLRSGSKIQNRPRILLLSATPYKLYSTLDEIDETQNDEHYKEFIDVIKFLLDDDQVRIEQFKSVWLQFSKELCGLKRITTLDAKKKQMAETALYNSGMCRTERISFVEKGDFLKDKKEELSPNENDVLAYMEFCRILKELKLSDSLPYEFAKSSPYLLSFMEKYKLKQKIQKKLNSRTAKNFSHCRVNRSLLCLCYDSVKNYDELPKYHAKLECLRKHAFEHHAEHLLWIPPSLPNYAPQGVFKEAEDFSKLLIFSAWEMVPRMIASLISYDAECRTNGKLCKEHYKSLRKSGKRTEMKTLHYMNESRFPQKRLFNVRDKKGIDRLSPQAEILRIQSSFLIKCFPTSGKLISLKSAREMVRKKIESQFKGKRFIPSLPETDTLIALVDFLDGKCDSNYKEKRNIKRNDINILTDMALAAPGICILRSLQHYFNGEPGIEEAAKDITKSLLRMFDSSEGIGAIANSCADLKNYERKVLQYCVDGNFQAMFDEYCYLQKIETNGNIQSAAKNICSAINLHTATYDVPTWEFMFQKDRNALLKMRSHYAVGFNKSTKESDDTNTDGKANRKESIRTAFNSPFRPFVLASTSVGQEGLDFHYYCRRIMHWNLPHNPIEMEQREGRVNRYLCLAVRNSMASYFRKKGNAAVPDNWDDLVSLATKEAEKNNHPYSGITPYWCFSKDQPVKIERIVPLYPFSRDNMVYERLMNLLSLYRLTMGQARQEEILNSILANHPNKDQVTKDLFISLCPFQKSNTQ